jgi:hypothetical protein
MSQIEQEFRQFLSAKPEIEKCYAQGLINRRSLARHLIEQGIATKNQFDAVVAMLRRFPFDEKVQDQKQTSNFFKNTRITIKDKICILDFKKEKSLLQKLQKIVAHTDYDKGDTLKVVLGSGAIKVFLDQKKEEVLKEELEDFSLKHTIRNVSEISMLFPEDVMRKKAIISFVANELAMNDIIITEFLTASPELLIYIKEEYVVKAYETLKRIQK